ncbi:chemosensory receptor a [Plakobranchus ocellatus]|uniref:Chemosensory receptor a n=1 Tax=Plakobranchus ocellatus TaxID=259542 RepID=A0AAV3ZBF1_9GAST|nr:chemosensory receptor a [Plakobranchus ocellatus]
METESSLNTGTYIHFESAITVNTTVATEREMRITNMVKPILSAEVHDALVMFSTWTGFFATVVGMFSNALVIVTYAKVGFSDTINISYSALGISDLSTSVFRCWGTMCYILVLTNTKVPFDPLSVGITTSFFPGQGFEKTTAFLTAFIALERCLCVQFPLHVKRIVTKKITVTSIVIIFVFTFAPSNLIHMVYPFKFVYSPAQNRTILAMIPLQTPLRYIIQRALLAYYGTVLHFTALIVVWICTVFLAVGLKRTAKIRKDKFKNTSAQQDTQRGRRVIKTVFLLAVTYLACSTPIAATMLVPHFVPEFDSTRSLARISAVSHLLSGVMNQINSNTNLFIFLYMGSKFRETFLRLFGKKSPIKPGLYS